MGTKPKVATRIIKVLNYKTWKQLQEINIPNRTATILEIKKVLMKKNLLTQLKAKCEALNIAVERFHSRFSILKKKA